MLTSPYPIMDDWDEYSSAYQREISEKMFLTNIIQENVPNEVEITWENTSDNHLERAKRAVDEQSFENFRINVNRQDDGCEVIVRAHADYIDTESGTELVPKRLTYTASIAIYRTGAQAVAELSAVPLDM